MTEKNPLRIVIVVAGTRGDVQPLVALAAHLQRTFGHDVRLATHELYRPLVEEMGVSFSPLGGDVVALTRVSVSARGMLPCNISDMQTIRREYQNVLESLQAACTLQVDDKAVAPDLIITTPITYGVPHVAEALRVPLHLISAVPWYPSTHLAHPWARAFDKAWTELADDAMRWVLPAPPPGWAGGQEATSAVASRQAGPEGAAGDAVKGSVGARVSMTRRVLQWLVGKYARTRAGVQTWVRETVSYYSTFYLDRMTNMGIADQLIALRLRLGLRPWGPAWNLYRYPHTFTFSRHLLPPPPDWPDTTAVSGPLLLNQLSPPPTPPPHPDTHTNTHTNTSDTPHIALTGADRYSTAASTLAKALTATHSAIDDLMPELSIASYHGLFLDSSDVLENVFASVGGSLSGTGTGGTGTGAAQTPTAPKGAAEPQRRKGASYRSSLERAVPAAAAAPAGAADIPPTADTKAHHDKAPVTNGHATAARTDGEPAAEDDTGEGEGMDECVSGGSGEGGIESAFARASTQLLFMPLGLDDFLKAGPAPVYVGFGSCSAQLAEDVPLPVTITLAACVADVRVVINRSMWVGISEEWECVSEAVQRAATSHMSHVPTECLTPQSLRERVYLVDDMPHDMLLPRCSGVAHHGGVGTLQAGLLAGCPTLVCPVYGDQFWWGEVVHRAGVGPAPLPAHHLTCASLAKAFTELQRPDYVSKARHVSELIQEETSHFLDVAARHALKTAQAY